MHARSVTTALEVNMIPDVIIEDRKSSRITMASISPEDDGEHDAGESVAMEIVRNEPIRIELPSVLDDVDSPADDQGEGDEGNNEKYEEEEKLVLPSVAGIVSGTSGPGGGGPTGSNSFAESIILDGDEADELTSGFVLPRIEVQPSGKLSTGIGLPTWNDDNFETLVLCRKPRKEIIAENAHPKCFGNVGASGLSRVFTSGSFCPDMSSRSMAVRNPFNLVPPISMDAATLQEKLNERTRPIARSKTIADFKKQKQNRVKMPEIRTSKVSLFSRDGERAKNMFFVPTARMTQEDRAKTDLESLRQPAASRMPRLTERYGSFVKDGAKFRDEQKSIKQPESESDELTPSEAGIMGNKINDWFTTGRKEDPQPKTHHNPKNKRHSKNIWDPGIQRRIHRGLASSVFKPNACIGNYLNDVTASRFPQVETRQIVFTR